MSYNKKIWENGDLITKERMNNIEDGIYNAHEEINTLKNNTSTGGGGSGEVDLSGYVTKETGNANQITFADGQTFQAKLDSGTLKGEKGDKGDKGDIGPQGPKGDPGEGGTGSNNASDITIADTNNNYSSGDVEGALNEIANSIRNFVSTEGISSYDTFPSDSILNGMAMNTVFEVRGFYNIGDMPRCAYQKVGWAENAIVKDGYYIKPVTYDDGSVFLPQIGIRQGSAYASQNSSILESINFKFAATLRLPIGDFYFDRSIDLLSNQMSLIGECVNFTLDSTATSFTVVNFRNLPDGGKGIIMGTGTLCNITVRGNKSHYDYVIDRNQTYVNKDNIEQEVCTRKCYGIHKGRLSYIQNVKVENFYYGCMLETNNIYIDNFFAHKCHIGLSIGADTKCKGIYGWHVHTLLQMRNSISSAIQVRADSCHHLVHLTGYSSCIQLTDLDGDYCVGSLIKVGVYDEWGSVQDVIINGITGRACCINCYDSSKDEVPTSAKVTNKSDVSNWGLISVENNTQLDGAIINMAKSNISSNPHDEASTLRTPPILIASAGVCYAIFNTTFKNEYGELGEINIKRQTLLDGIALLSGNANSARICLNTPSGAYYLHKESPTTIYTTKQSTETLE